MKEGRKVGSRNGRKNRVKEEEKRKLNRVRDELNKIYVVVERMVEGSNKGHGEKKSKGGEG